MCSGFSMTSFDLFDTLETKLSCSALAAHAAVALGNDPAPAPGTDPGDLPPDNGPIVYLPTDESGPVGPGAHMPHAQRV